MRGVWALKQYIKEQGRIGIHGWLQGRLGVSAAGILLANENLVEI